MTMITEVLDTRTAAEIKREQEEAAESAGEHSILNKNKGPRHPLTKEMIVESCLKNGFYRTPSCNERLYLHFKGIDSLGKDDDVLKEYTEVICAWLEGNCLTSLEGIQNIPKVRCLYLHQNMLAKITHLDKLVELDSINLSDNYIKTLSGFDSQAKTLSTLQMKNNKLRDKCDYDHLTTLQNLRTLDISGNEIQNGEDLLEVLEQMPNLKSLYLAGNPFVREIRNFRKTVLSRLPGLMHLDDKPVFEDERRLVTAWAKGGMAGEKDERKKIKEEELAATHKRLDDFRDMVRKARLERGEKASSDDDDDSTESEFDSNPTSSSDDDEEEGENKKSEGTFLTEEQIEEKKKLKEQTRQDKIAKKKERMEEKQKKRHAREEERKKKRMSDYYKLNHDDDNQQEEDGEGGGNRIPPQWEKQLKNSTIDTSSPFCASAAPPLEANTNNNMNTISASAVPSSSSSSSSSSKSEMTKSSQNNYAAAASQQHHIEVVPQKQEEDDLDDVFIA